MEREKVFFVGIGGIGMSALAQLYLSKGAHVSGSDRGESDVTRLLESKGITVYRGQKKEQVPKDATLVVYSDAVPEDNEERMQARTFGIRERSYFEALGEATKNGHSIVISGTHGKTSTTAMIAKILIDAGERPTVIAGSILKEHGSNFVEGRDDLFVIEGCEYRRHFLHLHPTILVITNIELDHTDYYKDLVDMQDAFQSVIALLPEEGALVTDTGSESIIPLIAALEKKIVSFQDVSVPILLVPGEFNKKNAQAAKSAVLAYADIKETQIDTSLADFRGTWRRFEYKGVTKNGAVVYDDYAHHPTAVEGTINMVRREFPEKKLTVIFHPHLYSRTKSFFNEFASSLALADETILLPIYAAREQPDPSVASEALVRSICEKGGNAHYAKDFETAKTLLFEKGTDTLILTMGAGDVYLLGEEIIEANLDIK